MTFRFRAGEPIVLGGRLWGPSGDVQVRLLLDTGASRTLVNPRRLAQVGIEPLEGFKSFSMTTVDGVSRAPLIEVPALAILGVRRPDFEVVAHALPPSAPIDGLLGLDFLAGLRLVLDMRQGELTVEA